MISFEINQQIGKKIPPEFFRRILKEIVNILDLKSSGKISIAIIDFKTIKNLNLLYRGKNRPTDVLSFSEIEGKRLLKTAPADKNYLGEVIICYPQAVKQAKANKKSLESELGLLFVHGVLHILGFDHNNPKAKEKMWRNQEKILKKSGLTGLSFS